MRDWTARCQDCKYCLWNRGEIGTQAFAIKHAINNKHKVIVNGPNSYTVIDNRATLETEPADRAPF